MVKLEIHTVACHTIFNKWHVEYLNCTHLSLLSVSRCIKLSKFGNSNIFISIHFVGLCSLPLWLNWFWFWVKCSDIAFMSHLHLNVTGNLFAKKAIGIKFYTRSYFSFRKALLPIIWYINILFCFLLYKSNCCRWYTSFLFFILVLNVSDVHDL